MLRFLLSATALAVAAGCATSASVSRPNVTIPAIAPKGDDTALDLASQAFFTAKTFTDLHTAVERARQAGYGTARYHELAAKLAFLESRIGDRFDHLFAAILDPSSDATSLHLELLDDFSWTSHERARAEALFQALIDQHPDPSVRAKAAFMLAKSLHLRGDQLGVERARAQQGGRLPFSFIGAWDNEQGKGFDAVFGPEDEINFKARYDGSLVEVGWRTKTRAAFAGPDYDLVGMFSPNDWSVVYAAAGFKIHETGDYELRFLSSAPIKVWANDTLIYAERRVETETFDQFVLPVRLRKGINRVLVKLAQNTGRWVFSGRLTGAKGALIRNIELVPADASEAGVQPDKGWTTEELLERRVAAVRGVSVRKRVHGIEWARALGFTNLAVSIGDEIVSTHKDTILGRYLLAGALWNHGELDRASDVLTALDEQVGNELPFVRLQHARLLRQGRLMRKARKALVSVRDAHPKLADVWVRLARQFGAEGWKEDRCRALEEADRLRPNWLSVRVRLAECVKGLGFESKARNIYREILAELPNSREVLRNLQAMAQENDDLPTARSLAQRMTVSRPDLPGSWLRLAEASRRAGDREGAEDSLQNVLEIDPDLALAWRELGRVAYQHGEKDVAIERWQAALYRSPDDEKLANRLSFLAPESREPWDEEVPDEEALDLIVETRKSAKPMPGADVIELLDHLVTRINPDGSTREVTSRVLHAVNKAGRDRLTQSRLPRGGRVRVLHAYAVDPEGRRVQVSSIRRRVARFRGLKVGSTVVIQYRHDLRPVGYLARNVARSWWFQGASAQREISRWIVWAPGGTTFHEWVNGKGIKRNERIEGEHVRVSWSATKVPPIIPEPNMPTALETTMSMLLSTVPSWEAFLEWEKALLHDVFRDSPEVKELARQLFEGVEDPQGKVDRIHRYLMEHIRYQQDYESHIAGVKPHPATVVLKRNYGDCKDKAVLFITLARLANIDVRFALLRTRTRGPLRREVPMQQFDHAIVYVPAQTGIAQARFYDPTADALDLAAIRSDDPGATALVLDTKTNKHEWIDIPYQAADMNGYDVRSALKLSRNGWARGQLEFSGRGKDGSAVRRLARNEQRFEQGMQLFGANAYPGATVSSVRALEVKDLSAPAKVAMELSSPAHGRIEGRELRFTLPAVWSPEQLFRLSERKYALVLGVPRTQTWHTEVEIPKGSRVSRLPSTGKIEAECFSLERTSKQEANKLIIDQRFTSKCERIPVKTYPEHRGHADAAIRFYKEEVVINLAGTRGPAAKL